MKRAAKHRKMSLELGSALFRAGLMSASLGAFLAACSTDNISGTGLRSVGGNGSNNAQKKATTKNKAGGTATDGIPDDLAAAADPNAPTSAGGAALEDIIKSCGIDAAKLNDPNAQLLNLNLRSLTAVISGTKQQPSPLPFLPPISVSYRIDVQFSQGIDARSSGTTQSTDFSILAVSTSVGAIGESQARSEATAQLNANKGTTTSKDMGLLDGMKLMGSNQEWSGAICTVMPTSELTVNKGGYSKTIRFTPALPSTVSPLADASRYAEEIGKGRTFTNIKAEVVSSNDPNMPAGRVIMGTVSVAPAAPSYGVPANANGGSAGNIAAEAAYKMSWSFGSVADTVNLGLMPSQTYFINHSQHALAYAVGETGIADVSTLVLHP